jgi:hypothetical protein
MFSFGVLVLSTNLLIAVADRVPSLEIKNTCRNAATVTGPTTQDDIKICLQDEQDARDQLAKEWPQFSASAKERCVRASQGYLPSYVELITCLSMARDAKSAPEENTQRPRKERR